MSDTYVIKVNAQEKITVREIPAPGPSGEVYGIIDGGTPDADYGGINPIDGGTP